MSVDLFVYKRKNYISLNKLYFWTVTINQWQHLLTEDIFKEIIIQSLNYLTVKNKMDVYGFVIMPNHIHLIIKTKELNGKETAQGSFLKYTAHEFRKKLLQNNPSILENYRVEAKNKEFEFWQRDSLAIEIYTPEVAFQKLTYIHNNPLAEHWQLAKTPSDYKYSSAKFYETRESDFVFLKDIRLII